MSQLSIGQFSKMTRLSIKALRLYNEKNLLQPKYVNTRNNYRYYSREQGKVAEIIRILRACGMSLDDIRTTLEMSNDQQTRVQLRLFKTQLSASLDEKLQLLNNLDELLGPRTEATRYEFRTEKLPVQSIVGIRLFADFQTIAAVTKIGFQQLFHGLQSAQVTVQGPPMLIYHHLIDPESSGEIEFCAPITEKQCSSSLLQYDQIQASKVAYVIHKGEQHKLGNAYRFLINSILESGFEFSGAPREIYLNDPAEVLTDALLTRIEFPIAPTQK